MSDSIFPGPECISRNESTRGRLCVYLKIVEQKCITGETVSFLTCSCEEDMCASCMPEFYDCYSKNARGI